MSRPPSTTNSSRTAVVASLEYQHNFYQNGRNLFPTSPTSNTETRNHDEDLIGVNLRYAFH